MEYDAGRSLKGYVGLWTKADSVTCFENLIIETTGRREVWSFDSVRTCSHTRLLI